MACGHEELAAPKDDLIRIGQTPCSPGATVIVAASTSCEHDDVPCCRIEVDSLQLACSLLRAPAALAHEQGGVIVGESQARWMVNVSMVSREARLCHGARGHINLPNPP